MNDYVETDGDNGGVHVNSGIPNRAFYLVAVSLGGYAWESAGRIWYEALRDPALRDNTGFRRFAKGDRVGCDAPLRPQQRRGRRCRRRVGYSRAEPGRRAASGLGCQCSTFRHWMIL